MAMADDSGVSVHMSKPDEAETSIVSSLSPVVFQCSQCNSVVGDSTSWVSANKIMRSITLRNVTSRVGVKTNLEVSENGVDKGSTFYTVYCISCNDVLGRQYVASSPDLDFIRGCFTFHVEKLNSYEVGSAEVNSTSDMADMMSVPSPQYMHTQINKIRYLIMSMNERLKSLEDHVSGNPSTGSRVQNDHEEEEVADSDNHNEHGDALSVSSGETGTASTKVRRYSSSTAMTEETGISEMHPIMSSNHNYTTEEVLKQRQFQKRNDFELQKSNRVGTPEKRIGQQEKSDIQEIKNVGHVGMAENGRRMKAADIRQNGAHESHVNTELRNNFTDRVYKPTSNTGERGYSKDKLASVKSMQEMRSPKVSRSIQDRHTPHKGERVEQEASPESPRNPPVNARSGTVSTDIQQWPISRETRCYMVKKKRKISQ